MMEILGPVLVSILTAVLIPIAIGLGKLLGQLIRKGISKINNEILQNIAWTVITFVEQKFKDLHGKDKFDKAYEAVAAKLPGIAKEDIEHAIEAAVGAMNLSKNFPSSSTTP